MDAFEDYTKQRLKEGRINCIQLLVSLKQRGVDGSVKAVQRFVRTLRKEQLKGRMCIAVPFGSSLLTDDHHWIVRLMQGDIAAGDLLNELGETLPMEDAKAVP